MPLSLLATLADERVTAFDGFVAVLRTDPILKAVGLTVRDWSGGTSDTDPPAAGELPLAVVTPSGGPTGWVMSQTHSSVMFIDVDLVIEGSAARESMRLWRAIERAYFPPDPLRLATVQARLLGSGISAIEIVQAGFGVTADKADTEGRIHVTGRFSLAIYIPTPVY